MPGGPLLQLDCHLLDLTGELERHLIVFTDRRAGILTDVERFVKRHPVTDGARIFYHVDLLAVHRQRSQKGDAALYLIMAAG